MLAQHRPKICFFWAFPTVRNFFFYRWPIDRKRVLIFFGGYLLKFKILLQLRCTIGIGLSRLFSLFSVFRFFCFFLFSSIFHRMCMLCLSYSVERHGIACLLCYTSQNQHSIILLLWRRFLQPHNLGLSRIEEWARTLLLYTGCVLDVDGCWI